jgi:hypothetical protein
MEVILLISLVIATIGVIYFKEDRDFWEEKYEEYRDDYFKLLDERSERMVKEWDTKRSLLEEIKELRTYLKAVLYNLDNKEITIQETDKEIRGEIQVTKDLVRYAETIKLVPEEKIKKL